MYLKTKGTFNKYIFLPNFVYVEHMIMTLVARKYPIVLGRSFPLEKSFMDLL